MTIVRHLRYVRQIYAIHVFQKINSQIFPMFFIEMTKYSNKALQIIYSMNKCICCDYILSNRIQSCPWMFVRSFVKFPNYQIERIDGSTGGYFFLDLSENHFIFVTYLYDWEKLNLRLVRLQNWSECWLFCWELNYPSNSTQIQGIW